MSRSLFYLPSEYKNRKNVTVAGEAKSGEISKKGLVAQKEDWEGRIEVQALPSTIHMVYERSTGKFRMKTMEELVEEGKFILGRGPTGIMRQRSGIERSS